MPATIESMVAQTLQPTEWVIVDDGSTDNTAEIVEKAAAEHSWIRLVRRGDRGFRKLGGGVIDTFNDGLATTEVDWDYVGKLDADLTFGPEHVHADDRHELARILWNAVVRQFRPVTEARCA